MDLWQWITTTTTVDSIVSTLGLGALAVLFATNRVLTRGQHLDRIGDLKEHHEHEMAEIRDSRDGWRAVAMTERERADKATSSLDDMKDSLEAIEHVLASLDSALPPPPNGSNNDKQRRDR